MPVHPVTDPSDNFSHSKGSQNSSDPQALHISQEGPGHKDGQGQTGYVKTDLHSGIGQSRDPGKFPWKKICRYNGHLTPVRQSNTKADKQVADTEI